MIKVICAMLIIVINNLKVQINNSNLLLRKSAIRFKLLVKKRKISKQTTGILYYKY